MEQSHKEYAYYKLSIEDVMEKHNWLNIANGIELRPGLKTGTSATTAEIREWDQRDHALKDFLFISLPSVWKPMFSHVPGGGHELWTAIVNEFERETFKEHTKLVSSLFNVAQDINESLVSYVERVKHLVQQLALIGEAIPVTTQVMCFLQGLNYYYKPDDIATPQEYQLTLEQAALLIKELTACKQANRPINLDAAIGAVIGEHSVHHNDNERTASTASGAKPTITSSAGSKPAVSTTADAKESKRTATAAPASKQAQKLPPAAVSVPPKPAAGKPSAAAAAPSVRTSPPTAGAITGLENLHDAHRPAYKVTSLHRGLKNSAGENNCFLNVTIQALWHLGPFRTHLTRFINEHSRNSGKHAPPQKSAREVVLIDVDDAHHSTTSTTLTTESSAASSYHTPHSDCCDAAGRIPEGSILEAVCNLFIQYEFTDMTVLPATELRESLSLLSDHFKLGTHADANEAFDTILQRIHTEQNAACPQEHKCLAHQVFGGCVMEQSICDICGASSEPALRNDFILCFQAAELLLEAKALFAKTQVQSDGKIPNRTPSPSGFSKFLSFGRSKFPALHRTPTALKAPTESSNGGSSATEHAHHYTDGCFGKVLSKCMALTHRSCPSRDRDAHYPGTSASALPGARAVSGAASSAQMLNNISSGAAGVYTCNGRATVHQYSLDPPLALALSVGWTSDKEARDTLRDFFDLIAYSVRLGDLFQVHGETGGSSGSSGGRGGASQATASVSVSSTAGSVGHGPGRSNGTSVAAVPASAHPPAHSQAQAGPSHTHRSTTTAAPTSTSTSDTGLSSALTALHIDTANPSYVFRGLVCYYGQHYVSIFQSREVGRYEYLLFDDHNIKVIGDWEAVKQKCVMSCYQPVLLLYELES